MLLGEGERCIELLKKNNAGGVYSDTIGMVLALNLKRHEEAAPFLAEALLLNTLGLVDSVIGYALVLSSRKEYADAKRMLSGLISYLESFKEGEKADFADKIMASMYTVMAYIYTLEGQSEEAAKFLHAVLAAVRKFDATPDYGIRTLRYPVHRTDVILNDALGATAADSIETILDLLGNQELSRNWKELADNG